MATKFHSVLRIPSGRKPTTIVIVFSLPIFRTSVFTVIGYIYRFTATGLPPTHGVYASYDFANPLGTGSFGTVMRAVHRATETWYAIKMIRPKGTLKHTKQFMREIDIMERLQHPNICQLKEWFIDDTKQICLSAVLILSGRNLIVPQILSLNLHDAPWWII